MGPLSRLPTLPCRSLNGQTRNFTGKLKNYKKDDLKAVALALRLSDSGNKYDLSTRIDNHFQVHPADKDNPRFAALFHVSTGRGQRQAVTVPPQPSEEQLDEQNDSTADMPVLLNDSDGPQAGPSQHNPHPTPNHPTQTHPMPSSYSYHYPQYNPYTNPHQFYYATPSTSTFRHYTHNLNR